LIYKQCQRFEKNESLSCLAYVYDELEIKEEVNGVAIKRTKKFIKLFVGTQSNNIYSYDLDFLLEGKITQASIPEPKTSLENFEDAGFSPRDAPQLSQQLQAIVDKSNQMLLDLKAGRQTQE